MRITGTRRRVGPAILAGLLAAPPVFPGIGGKASRPPAKARASAAAAKKAALPALVNCTANVVPYDIVYVHAPRYGDAANTSWPDTTRPMQPDPGADLRLLRPDCTEEVLFPLPSHQAIVDAPIGNGAVSDPNVSFDGPTTLRRTTWPSSCSRTTFETGRSSCADPIGL